MIRVEGLRVVYPGGHEALRGASLESPPGRITVVAGPNGSGKSTLLLAVRGLIPWAVKARVDGVLDVYGVDPRRDPRAVSRLVQGTLQDPKVQVVGPTVLAEAALTLAVAGAPRGVVLERARQALRLVGLEGLEERPTHRLSTGQLARAGLAGALAPQPRHLVLDEPTSHLDEAAASSLILILRALTGRGIGVLAASHDPRLWEEADNCYTMKNGEARSGCPEPPPPPRRQPKTPGGTVAALREAWARYPGDPGWALRGASVEARRGELVVLYGPNGGGKTSILLALAGLLPLARGEKTIHEEPGFLPPDPLLVFHRGTLREQAGRVPGWALHLASKPLYRMSGGERRLAALAAIVSLGRRLLLLDEPTDWLDPWWRREVSLILQRLAAEGYTIVAASHDKSLLAVADRAYRVEDGRAWPA